MLTVQYAHAHPAPRFNAVAPGITPTEVGGGDTGSHFGRPAGRTERADRRTARHDRPRGPDRHLPGGRRRARLVVSTTAAGSGPPDAAAQWRSHGDECRELAPERRAVQPSLCVFVVHDLGNVPQLIHDSREFRSGIFGRRDNCEDGLLPEVGAVVLHDVLEQEAPHVHQVLGGHRVELVILNIDVNTNVILVKDPEVQLTALEGPHGLNDERPTSSAPAVLRPHSDTPTVYASLASTNSHGRWPTLYVLLVRARCHVAFP